MTRNELVLAVLASKAALRLSPVQVQKLFFIIDEEISDEVGGRKFNFGPYNFGPFDKDVYRELENLAEQDLAVIDNPDSRNNRSYSLTAGGYQIGCGLREELTPRARDYIDRLVAWIEPLDFDTLVSSVYKSYPEMRVNSIYRS